MEIHFVQHEGYGRSKNNIHGHHARAHTARVNRKRRKEQAQLAYRTKNYAITLTKSSSSHATSTSGATTPQLDGGTETETSNASTTALTLRKTLSPVYGAFSAGLFDPVAMPAAAEVLHYNMTVIFKDCLTKPDLTIIYPSFIHKQSVLDPLISDRFRIFCEHPAMFHSYFFTAAAHHDILRRQIGWYQRPEMIVHKVKCIQLLNGMIPNLTPENIEVAIVTVMYLEYGELDDGFFERLRNPFDSIPPPLCWQEECWNGMLTSDMHAKAIYMLVQQVGGLEKIQMPAVALNLARWDLRRASILVDRPRYACAWAVDERLLRPRQFLNFSHYTYPGQGFRNISGKITSDLSTLLVDFATLNAVIHDMSQGLLYGHHSLRDARSAMQYWLLMTPRWNESPSVAQASTSRSIYECCRLTTILYSTAVLLCIPPGTGWAQRLLPMLKSIIRSIEVNDGTYALLLWSTALAWIASQDHPPFLSFFESTFRNVVMQRSLIKWSAVEKILESFMWSRLVCGRGARQLWDAIQTKQF